MMQMLSPAPPPGAQQEPRGVRPPMGLGRDMIAGIAGEGDVRPYQGKSQVQNEARHSMGREVNPNVPHWHAWGGMGNERGPG